MGLLDGLLGREVIGQLKARLADTEAQLALAHAAVQSLKVGPAVEAGTRTGPALMRMPRGRSASCLFGLSDPAAECAAAWRC